MAVNRSSLIPATDPVVDQEGKMTIRWLLFLQQLLNGDPGVAWTPNFVNLNSNGAPTITGVYYENSGFIDFFARIVPAVNTSSTSGATYLELPFQPSSDCAGFTVTGNNATPSGIVASQRRMWLPGWNNLTTPITATGRVPIQS